MADRDEAEYLVMADIARSRGDLEGYHALLNRAADAAAVRYKPGKVTECSRHTPTPCRDGSRLDESVKEVFDE